MSHKFLSPSRKVVKNESFSASDKLQPSSMAFSSSTQVKTTFAGIFHDFSRIPIHRPASSTYSTDAKEFEADRAGNLAVLNPTPLPVPENIHLHTDTQAAELAEILGARAFTVNNDIFFNRNAYAPETREGIRLLAHELTHAVQQSTGRSVGPQLQGDGPLFYQSVIDTCKELEGQIKVYGKSSWEPDELPACRALITLCEAVEQGRKDDIPELLDTFIEEAVKPAARFLKVQGDVIDVLAIRMMLMGLETEGYKIRSYNRDISNWRPPGTPIFLTISNFWGKATQFVLPEQLPDKGQDIVDTLQPALLIFGLIQKERLRITPKDLRDAYDNKTGFSYLTPSFIYDAVYCFDSLGENLCLLMMVFQEGLHRLLENAIGDLEAGADPTGCESLRQFQLFLAAIIEKCDIDLRVYGLMLAITKTDFENSVYQDFFQDPQNAKDKQLKFRYYDEEDPSQEEKEVRIQTALKARQNQANLLNRLYGPENATALPMHGQEKMKLHSLDDWQTFTFNKFKELEPVKGREEALRLTLELLQDYLQAFTTNVPYNLYDRGSKNENYLTRQYPRALTDQLLHDCGIYALQAAYILMQLREEFKFKTALVTLPNHVALALYGDQLPMIVLHNNTFHFQTAASTEALYQYWLGQNQGTPDLPREQFLGEYAGGIFFLQQLDFPFQIIDVPLPGKRKKYAAELWTFYQKKACDLMFAGTQDPLLQQFHLKYLEVLDNYKQFHNTTLIDFWYQKARPAWTKFTAQPTEEGRDAYLETLVPAFDNVEKSFETMVLDKNVELSELYKSNIAKLKADNVRMASGSRTSTIVDILWRVNIRKHIEKVIVLTDFSDLENHLPLFMTDDIKLID